MSAIAEEQRRVKGRQIRSVLEIISLKRRPRRIDQERGESEEDQERLKPPRVATSCFSELTLGQGPHGLRHRESSEYALSQVSKPYRRWMRIASGCTKRLALRPCCTR